jgi:hypothetical protein
LRPTVEASLRPISAAPPTVAAMPGKPRSRYLIGAIGVGLAATLGAPVASRSEPVRAARACTDSVATPVAQPTAAQMRASGLGRSPWRPITNGSTWWLRRSRTLPGRTHPGSGARLLCPGRRRVGLVLRRGRLQLREGRGRRHLGHLARRQGRSRGVPARLAAPTSRALRRLARAAVRRWRATSLRSNGYGTASLTRSTASRSLGSTRGSRSCGPTSPTGSRGRHRDGRGVAQGPEAGARDRIGERGQRPLSSAGSPSRLTAFSSWRRFA